MQSIEQRVDNIQPSEFRVAELQHDLSCTEVLFHKDEIQRGESNQPKEIIAEVIQQTESEAKSSQQAEIFADLPHQEELQRATNFQPKELCAEAIQQGVCRTEYETLANELLAVIGSEDVWDTVDALTGTQEAHVLDEIIQSIDILNDLFDDTYEQDIKDTEEHETELTLIHDLPIYE